MSCGMPIAYTGTNIRLTGGDFMVENGGMAQLYWVGGGEVSCRSTVGQDMDI